MEPTAAAANMATAYESGNFFITAFKVGGPAMIVIAAIGALTIMLLIERLWALKGLTVDKNDFNEHLFGMVLRGDIRQAIAYCDQRPAPLTNTVKAGLVQALNKRPDEEVQVAMDAALLREMPKIEGWTAFLAVFGNVAVLAGLLGTIIGMVGSFRAVSMADNATKAELLSQGISHALNCTAFGLCVAIVAIVSYGIFQHQIQKTENEVIETSMSLLNLVVANRDKIKD